MSSSELETTANPGSQSAPATWKPLTRNQRRVLGVLIEKSKTTPDVYPMSINGIKTGSNQKTNRSPVLELNEHQVEETLYELRHLGVVIEVHSGGRVPKYKHQAYDWLSVDKPELGVLAELLLRGEQSVGDLRARAARMEKAIGGLEELRPILASLKHKNLIVELTSPGRGQIVTHNLYRPEELNQLRHHFESGSAAIDTEDDAGPPPSNTISQHTPRAQSAATFQRVQDEQQIASLQEQVKQLMSSVEQLQADVLELRKIIES